MNAPRKPIKSAVGLAYDEQRDQSAPQVSVTGHRLAADEILRIAKRFNVPIVEDANLAQALSKLDADTEIPEELYASVAAILRVLKEK